jgi:hypothetical protein
LLCKTALGHGLYFSGNGLRAFPEMGGWIAKLGGEIDFSYKK